MSLTEQEQRILHNTCKFTKEQIRDLCEIRVEFKLVKEYQELLVQIYSTRDEPLTASDVTGGVMSQIVFIVQVAHNNTALLNKMLKQSIQQTRSINRREAVPEW
jgi:hypothetical protein